MFVLMLAIGSCSQKTFDSKKELMAYVTDSENGYTQQKTVNGVDFSFTYRPTDMLVSQELIEGMPINAIDSLREKYSKQIYFNISLSKNDKEILSSVNSSRTDFGIMVKQLAFGMGNKVHLFSQTKDTIELLDYIYPRAYGMGGATNILFVYPREEVLGEGDFFHFTIEDIGFSTGEVGFKVPIKSIKNEPKLKFE